MTSAPEYDPILSTRIWRFETDQIRLSSLSNTRILDHIRDTFRFDWGELTSPTIRGTPPFRGSPPGLEFRNGLAPINMEDDDEFVDEIAFRSLAIDANHLSIEVAGTSDQADQVFTYFRHIFSEATTPEGKPFIGTPESFRDFSLLALRNAEWKLDLAVVPGVLKELNSIMDAESLNPIQMSRIEFGTANDSDEVVWLLKPRYGTQPSQNVIESHAWLTCDAHRDLLEVMGRLLNQISLEPVAKAKRKRNKAE